MNYKNYIRFFLAVFWIALFSCTTPKKLNKVMNKLPEASAKECASRFPIKETTDTVEVIDTALIQAYENELFLLWKQLDSVLVAGCDTQYIFRIKEIIQKQPAKIETKYIIKTQESTAKYKVLLDSCDKISKQNMSVIDKITKEKEAYYNKYMDQKERADRVAKQRNSLYWWLLLVLVALFRKPLLRILKKSITKI
jgi:hypothetical protein